MMCQSYKPAQYVVTWYSLLSERPPHVKIFTDERKAIAYYLGLGGGATFVKHIEKRVKMEVSPYES